MQFLTDGVLPDSDVFRALVVTSRPQTVRQLCDRLRLSRNAVSTALDRLHRQRLVHDRPAPRCGPHSPRMYWSAGAGLVVGWLFVTASLHAWTVPALPGSNADVPCPSVNVRMV